MLKTIILLTALATGAHADHLDSLWGAVDAVPRRPIYTLKYMGTHFEPEPITPDLIVALTDMLTEDHGAHLVKCEPAHGQSFSGSIATPWIDVDPKPDTDFISPLPPGHSLTIQARFDVTVCHFYLYSR